MSNKMGFEGQIFFGPPGSTAATQLLNTADVSYNTEVERGSTTVRGQGLVPPINTSAVTARGVTIEFTMLNDSTDTALEQLRVAAATGAGVALRLKDNVEGKGYDGDVTLSVQHGKPLKGEQTLQFSAEPSRDYGRHPLLYV